MKKYILLAIIVVLNFNVVSSQDFQWAHAGISNTGGKIVQDSIGNFYVAVGGGIAKYNASGSFEWHQNIPFGKGLVADSIGNVYVTGAFGGTITISGQVLTSDAGGDANMYLAKYNTNGTFQWVTRSHSNEDSGTHDITIDRLGNPIIIGRFKDSLKLDSFIFDAPSTNQIFLAKYSPSGNCIWAKYLYSSSFGGGSNGPKIRSDNFGNSYLSGHFAELAQFDSIQIFSHHAYSYLDNDIFLAKIDQTGSFVWAKTLGGNWQELIGKMDVDKLGNIYINGYFSSSPAYFDSYTVNTINPGYDDFTAKYDSNGNCLWAKYGYSGNIAAADDGYYTNYPSFITKFDGAGTLEWTKAVSGTVSNAGMLVKGDSVFIAGSYNGTVNFDAHTLSTSSSQMYIAKLGPPALTTDIEELIEFSYLTIYPNPSTGQLSFHYSSNGSHEDLSIEIRNILGQLIFSKSYKKFTGELTDVIDLSKQTKGIYFLELITETKKETRRIAVN